MLAMHPEGNIEALSAVKRLTGIHLRLNAMDEITEIESTDKGVRVWITRYRASERRSSVSVTGRGIHLVEITQSLAGVWKSTSRTAWDVDQCMTNIVDAIRLANIEVARVWQEMLDRLERMGDFEPFVINHYGPGQTLGEWLEKANRERMAGRVGTSSFPMDTFRRTIAGCATDRMAKHWK